ncbi:hypothetical protein ATKI12_4387 [Kitasatospora sp. Ki12]
MPLPGQRPTEQELRLGVLLSVLTLLVLVEGAAALGGFA